MSVAKNGCDSQEASGNCGSSSKFDPEKFKNYLLNYRTSTDESDSESSFSLELDSSFKRMLEEKRQVTNKENNPPSSPSVQKVVNPPEKPLRKDLLKERLIDRMQNDSLNGSLSIYHSADTSSFVMQNDTISNDEEYAAINRLMADFNLDYEPSISRTPLKAIGLTRQSATEPMSHLNRTQSEQISDENSVSSSATSTITVDRYPDILCQIKTEETTITENIDDTLEEIEYVSGCGLNYVPKRTITEITASKTHTETEEVIVIDSSPENSFVTTQSSTQVKSAESSDYTFYTARADFTAQSKSCSVSERSSRTEETESSETISTEKLTIDVESIHSGSETVCPSTGGGSDTTDTIVNRKVSAIKVSEGSSATSNQSTDSIGEMPEFNDSLERIDYMMRKGKEMLNRKVATKPASPASKLNVPPTKFGSPAVKLNTPSKVNCRTPNSIQKKTPSAQKSATKPTTLPNHAFKKPDQRLRSPMTTASSANKQIDAKKGRIPCPVSQLPIAPFSSSKPQFRHIASPIAAYIKNTPEVPLMKTVKPVKDFFKSSYYNNMCKSNDHNESTQSIESFPIQSSLPRKVCNAAPQRQIIDHRQMVTPGGKSVQKLIGNAPLVIRHDGRIKGPQHPQLQQSMEESLSDLSVLSGDISVQVVKDVHRMKH